MAGRGAFDHRGVVDDVVRDGFSLGDAHGRKVIDLFVQGVHLLVQGLGACLGAELLGGLCEVFANVLDGVGVVPNVPVD